jgi:toxin ParE1/3/4
MSARRRAIRLTPDARQDYDDLLLYSLLTWGEAQMREYEAAIERALRSLADYPRLGRARDDLFPDCRCLPVERHLIFSRATKDEIVVSRLLHARQDAAGAVREPAGEQS